jgi:hypothetical protein
MGVLPFAILGAWVCFAWARSLAGMPAACVALLLWCASPNVLAHAAMITPDCGASALGAFACYLFWQWLRKPGWARALTVGVILGLAELTKFTWLILFGVWPCLWLLYRVSSRNVQRFKSEGAQLALTFILAVYVIHVGYGFEGTCRPLGEFDFISKALGGTRSAGQEGPSNRFRGTWMENIPVPVPRNYLQGIDVQKKDFEHGIRSYLRGEWKHGGWWYYYLYGLLIKEPIGYWLLGVIALWRALYSCEQWSSWRDDVVILGPAACVIGLVSSQTGFNHHLRYILPALPFIYIWIGCRVGPLVTWPAWVNEAETARGAIPARSAPANRRLMNGIVLGSLAWGVASSLWYWPHSLSYFNELVGGPLRGHAHLLDSNIDWGQDLLFLREWLNQHPEARPFKLAYFGGFDPIGAEIEYRLPPRAPTRETPASQIASAELGPQPGWHAISVNFLRGSRFSTRNGQGDEVYIGEEWYTYFLEHFQPVARAGYSIYIYHLTLEDANRVRRAWGVEELKEVGQGERVMEAR